MSGNTERELILQPGQSILDALIMQGMYISASCGGHGTCGRCIISCQTEGLSALTKLEKFRLSIEQQAMGKRFACQAKNCVSHSLSVKVKI